MNKIYNPSMQEEPYDHPTRIIPPRHEETIMDWLENTGRFLAMDLRTDYDNLPDDDLIDEIVEPTPDPLDEYESDEDDF